MTRRSITRRLLTLAVSILYVLAIAEIGSRLYLVRMEDAEFLHPDTILDSYYPRLERVKRERIDTEDGFFDVLLLGASVLSPRWGQIEEMLLERLRGRTGREPRIHNLAKGGLTSLDSYYQYRHLVDQRFDLVLFYHGINEVRANNIPDTAYRADYSHYSWYRALNLIEAHSELERFALPYVAAKWRDTVADRLDPPLLLPEKRPPRKWLEYGAVIRTAASLEANLRNVVEIARRKHESILLSTFAYHVPEDYSLERFKARSLDYAAHRLPVELWGEPRNVVAGLKAHNEVIRKVAADSGVMLVDMARVIPRDRIHFDDVCHLTRAGSDRFAEAVVPFVDLAAQRSATR